MARKKAPDSAEDVDWLERVQSFVEGIDHRGILVVSTNIWPITLVLATLASGCAALFVQGPSEDRDRRIQPTCTTSKGWVYLDDILGVTNAVAFWVYDDIEQDTGQDMTSPKVSAVLSAVVHGGSSLVGEQRVKACRRAHEEYEKYVVDGAPVPEPQPARRRQLYWCAASLDDRAVGACNKSKASCEASRESLIEAGHEVDSCLKKIAVTCFATVKGGELKRGCAPSVEACDREREQRILNASGPIEISKCAPAEERSQVVRIEPPPSSPDAQLEPFPSSPAPEHCVAIDGTEECFASAEQCAARRAAALPMYSLGECAAK